MTHSYRHNTIFPVTTGDARIKHQARKARRRAERVALVRVAEFDSVDLPPSRTYGDPWLNTDGKMYWDPSGMARFAAEHGLGLHKFMGK